jgi:hypothetical protein
MTGSEYIVKTLLGAIEAETIRQAFRQDNLIDAGVLKQLPAALQRNGMIVNDEDLGHDMPHTSSSARRHFALSRCTGI